LDGAEPHWREGGLTASLNAVNNSPIYCLFNDYFLFMQLLCSNGKMVMYFEINTIRKLVINIGGCLMVTYYISPRRRLAQRYAQMADSQHPEVQIPVDVIAEGDDFRITALVPGVKADELQIEILEDVVSIKGEFVSYLDEEAVILRRERPTGKFERSMRLPALLNAGGAEAEVVNGVLNLRVPKAEEAKAKQIKVKVK